MLAGTLDLVVSLLPRWKLAFGLSPFHFFPQGFLFLAVTRRWWYSQLYMHVPDVASACFVLCFDCRCQGLSFATGALCTIRSELMVVRVCICPLAFVPPRNIQRIP